MAPSWSFQKSNTSSPQYLDPESIRVVSTKLLESNDSLDTVPTSASPSYGRLHLLGLPSEVRDEIWQSIYDDIAAKEPRENWNKRPSNVYSGLALTCHQIHHEISFFWPRTIFAHRRITNFSLSIVGTQPDYKRLTLEIPHSQPYEFFLSAAAALKCLAPVLQDLRLFFVGSDKFQIPLSLNACGLHHPDPSLLSKRLTIEGQRHEIRQPLFLAVRQLRRLRSIVLSNHNMPLLQKCLLENKPYLKQVSLALDPRSTVHRKLDRRGITSLMIMALEANFPPVEILNISVNASFNMLQFIGPCMWNLRHLTWTVPDVSLQSAGGVVVNWYRDTSHLLHLLRKGANRLESLRMCFQEAIYEADTVAGTLMPAFHQHLQHLPIDTFELHMNSQSPWFGREIIQCLPSTLRRLYISRELLDEKFLAQDVDSRYMACHLSTSRDSLVPSRFLQRLQGIPEEKYIPVGDHGNRRDFISMGGGKLGFVGYEYDHSKATRFGNSAPRKVGAEKTKMWLLTLNGRLLDRERNMHLAKYDGAKPIPPRESSSSDAVCTYMHNIAENFAPIWVYSPPNSREIKAASHELAESLIMRRSDSYFGNECEAVKVFEEEPAVHPDDVLERLWPDEVSAHEEDHWMSDLEAVQYTMREERTEDAGEKVMNLNATTHSAWETERLQYWIENWIFYPHSHTYLNATEREEYLAGRVGEMLESLKL